jgi:hypothetical protein
MDVCCPSERRCELPEADQTGILNFYFCVPRVCDRRIASISALISLAAAAANADEVPSRVFHIGIVAGGQRSWPEHAAFEKRLRELGYVDL